MNLILHIGTEKTGTTSIQAFLSGNRRLLAERGILFPESLGRSNHRLLAGVANNDDFVDDLFVQEGLRQRDKRLAAKKRWLDQFLNEIDKKRPDTVIISSEHLQSRLSRPGEIERLHDILSDVFERIVVIIYLREPIATAVSAYSTAVKYGAVAADIPPPDQPYYFNLVNHARTLRRWSEVFGPDSLRVRLFECDALKDGEVVHDFIETAELPALDYVQPAAANPSLDALGIQLLRRMNRKLPRFKDGAPNPAREGLIDFFEAHFTGGAPFIPAPARIDVYRKAFGKSNRMVHKHYFPDRETLFKTYARADKQKSTATSQELDEMAKALLALWSSRNSST